MNLPTDVVAALCLPIQVHGQVELTRILESNYGVDLTFTGEEFAGHHWLVVHRPEHDASRGGE